MTGALNAAGNILDAPWQGSFGSRFLVLGFFKDDHIKTAHTFPTSRGEHVLTRSHTKGFYHATPANRGVQGQKWLTLRAGAVQYNAMDFVETVRMWRTRGKGPG